MQQVGVRQLKNNLSYYLSRVPSEGLEVTSRGESVAIILPSWQNISAKTAFKRRKQFEEVQGKVRGV